MWGKGSRVGEYEILGTLGNGGMGEVYKVRHVISDRTEAMKVLLHGSSDKPEIADRFVREIRLLAKLDHPNIAALRTAFQFENQLVMVMEYVDGVTLSERLRRGITLHQAVDYVSQVLTALDYAHYEGVVHRDIKPSNIMIKGDGQTKLLDFGLAFSNSPDPRLTSSKSLIGSVHYISPEQIRGGTVDIRSDIYAMGITLYELITGKLPIEGNTFPEIINNHLHVAPCSPRTFNSSIPATLEAVTRKALAKRPNDRYQTAAEFLSALQAVVLPPSNDLDLTMDRPVSTIAAHRQSPHPSDGSALARGFQPEILNQISAQLANYIGPIAKVVVKRASSGSNNLRELCDKVALEIESEQSRYDFLIGVRKHLRASGEL